jgi:hypothetical protein
LRASAFLPAQAAGRVDQARFEMEIMKEKTDVSKVFSNDFLS